VQDRLVDRSPDPESLMTEAQERNRTLAALKEALGGLNSRERRIIEARFLAERSETLENLALTFGVSRERIRQIELRALQKMKSAMRARLELADAARI
jgi:RNA polymerase sigma-32 factor